MSSDDHTPVSLLLTAPAPTVVAKKSANEGFAIVDSLMSDLTRKRPHSESSDKSTDDDNTKKPVPMSDDGQWVPDYTLGIMHELGSGNLGAR